MAQTQKMNKLTKSSTNNHLANETESSPKERHENKRKQKKKIRIENTPICERLRVWATTITKKNA